MAWRCSPSPPTSTTVVDSGRFPTQAFLLEWGTGHQLSRFAPGTGGSMHTNVWANEVLIATDDTNKTHSNLNHWLG